VKRNCVQVHEFLCELVMGEEALQKRVNELLRQGWDLEDDLLIETFKVDEQADEAMPSKDTVYRIMGSAWSCACKSS